MKSSKLILATVHTLVVLRLDFKVYTHINKAPSSDDFPVRELAFLKRFVVLGKMTKRLS